MYFAVFIIEIKFGYLKNNERVIKMKKHILDNSDLLYTEYITNDLTIDEIAKKYIANSITVSKYLKKYGIVKTVSQTRTSVNISKNANFSNICNKESLYNMYIVENKSISEIARICNSTRNTVKKYLHEFDITKDSNTKYAVKRKFDYIDYDYIKTNYIDLNKSIREISEETGISKSSFISKLKEYGIHKDTISSRYKAKQTNIERYGCEYSLQSKEIQEKIKQTNLERYGCEHISQSDEIKEKKKQTYLNKYGYENPSQSKEVKEKRKQVYLERYGCEYISQSKEIQEKIKQTNLERYGCEHISQSNEIKEKKKQAYLEHYGCENILQSDEIRNKIKQTNLERYGYEFPSQSILIKEKAKQTNLERYGHNYPTQSNDIKYKVRRTNLERYNFEYPIQNKKIQEKIKQTNLERYGCEYSLQSKEIQEKIKNKYFPNIVKYLSSKKEAEDFINNNYSEKTTVSQFANDINVSYTTGLNYIRRYNLEEYFYFNSNTSQPENDIIEYLKSKGIENIIQSDRNILDGKEIDIYLPDYNVGIEFNGDYWHSELRKEDKYYHYNKSTIAISKGIFLYHIFSHEWSDEEKRIRILNHLGNILHLNENKIYARKCMIREVDVTEKNSFLSENHIQGKDNSTIKLGLYYNDELVSLMTFCYPRFSKKYNWELSRFCSKHNYNVIGGASKLFKYFVNNYMKDGEVIVSYSDIAKTTGKIYNILNFEFVNDASPNYIWWKSDSDYKTRYQCQMKNEKEIMYSQGYVRVYDCGNKVWIYKKETRN